LKVPEEIREHLPGGQRLGGGRRGEGRESGERGEGGGRGEVTWIIEVSSQVLFSTSATVHYEILVGRDTQSIDNSIALLTSAAGHAVPGQLSDHQQGRNRQKGPGRHGNAQPKGIYSKSVKLVVDDTASLWNKPALPDWKSAEGGGSKDQEAKERRISISEGGGGPSTVDSKPTTTTNGKNYCRHCGDKSTCRHGKMGEVERPTKKRKVHLVVITHGLHSNIGADMLYLKESIDAAAKQARVDRRERRRKQEELSPDNDGDKATELASRPGPGDTKTCQGAPEAAALEEGQVDGAEFSKEKAKKSSSKGKGHEQSNSTKSSQNATAPLSGGQEDL
jgi:hypothetical protein